jgi:chromosome segregation ATPase
MSKVYQFLRGVLQETLQRSKTNSVIFPRVKGSDAVSLTEAMDELEKLLVDRLSRLKAAVKDGQAVVEAEAQHAEQLIETLKASVAVLEAKLKETEDTVRSNDVARQKMEESLATEIRDLQSAVKEKEEALESRGSEVNHLKSKLDVLSKQVTDLEPALHQAKEEAASEAQRAENLAESSKAKIATLEAQLRQAEQIARGKDWSLKEIEQSLIARIQDLETQVEGKEKLLADRDRQIADLSSELKRLTHEMKEKSSFFTQGEASGIQPQDIGPVVPGESLLTADEKLASSQSQDVGLAANETDATQGTLARDAFDRIIGELGEITNVMDTMASLIVRDHVKALGESMERFPKKRLPELLDNLSREISDEKLKTRFRERLGKL